MTAPVPITDQQIQQAALQAANRVMHAAPPSPTSPESAQLLWMDVQLVAGYLVQVLSGERWRSEFRSGDE